MLANLSLACVLEMAALVSVDLRKQHPLQTYGPWFCRIIPVARSEFHIRCFCFQQGLTLVAQVEYFGLCFHVYFLNVQL